MRAQPSAVGVLDQPAPQRPAPGLRGPPAGRCLDVRKYNVAGNTFIVVDELDGSAMPEGERAGFARWALDQYAGIGGADNVLFVGTDRTQDSDGQLLLQFRIFEQDGSETLSCGNGLLATAQLLAFRTGGTRWSVLTELPTGRPRTVQIGVSAEGGSWLELPSDGIRAMPREFYQPSVDTSECPDAAVETIALTLPGGAGHGRELVAVTGRLLFTGEPHLVVFVGRDGFPEQAAAELFPPASTQATLDYLDELGRYLNTRWRDTFPNGIHLNVVLPVGGALQIRTWERAIEKETLACGTGAIAVACVVAALDLAGGSPGEDTQIEVRPHRARWESPAARLHVSIGAEQVVLAGEPRLVFRGQTWPGQ